MKRVWSLVLAILMVVSMVPASVITAFADDVGTPPAASEEVSDQEGGKTQNPDGNDGQGPGEGTPNPGEGNGAQNPGQGAETPGEGGGTQNPGQGTENPGEGKETEGPAVDEGGDPAGQAGQSPVGSPAPVVQVTFVDPQGEGEPEVIDVDDEGKLVSRPTNPTPPEGMVFLGWFLEEEEEETAEPQAGLLSLDGSDGEAADEPAAEPVELNGVFDASVTLVARYALADAQTHTVTFMVGDTVYHTADNVADGQPVAEPGIPTPPAGSGSFKGWYLGDALYDFDSPVNGDITLTAAFNDYFTVSFMDAAGGTVIDNERVSVNGTVKTHDAVAKNLTAPAGQVFVHWSLEEDGVNAFNFSTPITRDTVLVPVFAKMHMVDFVTYGTPVAPQMVVEGQKATPPTPPTREGFTFKRWSATDGGTTAFDFNTAITGPTTLYAVWDGKTVNYSIAYYWEKPNLVGDAGTDVNNYIFHHIKTGLTAKAGTVFSSKEGKLPSLETVKYAEFSHSNTVTVAGNGSTVLNVYFKRITYTWVFDLDPSSGYTATMQFKAGQGPNTTVYQQGGGVNNKYTMQAKYEQDITKLWSSSLNAVFTHKKGSTSHGFIGWKPSGMGTTATLVSHRPVVTENMIPTSTDKTATLKAIWSGDAVEERVFYWFEELPGQTGEKITKSDGITYVKNAEYSQTFINDEDDYLKAKEINGMQHKSGYDSDGWEYPSTGKIYTYHFFYTRKTYKLSFDTDGGTPKPAEKTVKFEMPLKGYKPANPAKADWTFKGWALDAEGYKPFDFDAADPAPIMPNNDLKLFAQWENTKFKGSFYDYETDPATVYEGGADKDGYLLDPGIYQVNQTYGDKGVFLGWNWRPAGDGGYLAPYNFGAYKLTGNVKLYARWQTKDFKVEYRNDSGTGDAPTDTKLYDANVYAVVQDKAGTMQGPGNTVFAGWLKSDESRPYYPGNVVKMLGNVLFQARWLNSAQAVTLTLHANGGAGGPEVWTVAQNETVTLPGESFFIRSGYKLIGWSNTSGDGAAVDYALGGDCAMGTVNKTLYAVWEQTTVTVTFAAGANGSFGTAGAEVSFPNITPGTSWGSGFAVPTPVPAGGYYFAGWDKTFPATVTESATYTASFEPLRGTVTVTAKSASHIYDGTEKTVSGFDTADLPDGYTVDAAASGSGTNADSYTVAFTSAPVIRDGSDSDVTYQFTVITNPGTLTINPRPVVIVPTAASKAFGEPDPTALDYTIEPGAAIAGQSALVGGTTKEQFAAVIKRSSTDESVGEKKNDLFVYSHTTPANYSVTTGTADFTITQGVAEALAVTGIKKYYDGQSAQITVTGSQPGDTLQISFNRGLTWKSFEANSTFKNAINETAWVRATNPNYATRTVKDVSVQILPRPIVITAGNATKIYGDDNPAISSLTPLKVELGTPRSGYQLSGDPIIGSEVTYGQAILGIVRITPAGGPYKDAIRVYYVDKTWGNYDVKVVHGSMTVTKRDLTITVKGISKTYGDPDPKFKVSERIAYSEKPLNTLLGWPQVEVTKVSRAEQGEDVGDYLLKIALETRGSNYNVTVVDGYLTINPRPITVKAVDQTKVYGDEDPDLTYTITAGSLAAGDQASDIFTLEREYGEVPGGYGIWVIGKEENTNYDLTPTDGTLTITQRKLIITTGSSSMSGSSHTTLTNPKWDYAADSSRPVEEKFGDSLTVNVTGVQRGIGSSANTANVTGTLGEFGIVGEGEERVPFTDCYDVQIIPGTLRVYKEDREREPRPRPDVVIDDNPTPLAPGGIIILDGQVPLGALPKTGSEFGKTVGKAGILALLLGGVLRGFGRKKREDDEE